MKICCSFHCVTIHSWKIKFSFCLCYLLIGWHQNWKYSHPINQKGGYQTDTANFDIRFHGNISRQDRVESLTWKVFVSLVNIILKHYQARPFVLWSWWGELEQKPLNSTMFHGWWACETWSHLIIQTLDSWAWNWIITVLFFRFFFL